jgi:hypothetical protein
MDFSNQKKKPLQSKKKKRQNCSAQKKSFGGDFIDQNRMTFIFVFQPINLSKSPNWYNCLHISQKHINLS